MSLIESLKHLPEDLAAAIRRVTESGDAEVSVEPGLEIKMKLVIRPGSSGDDLDLDGKSLDELQGLLEDLQRELDILGRLKEALEEGRSARSVEFDSPEDYEFVESLTLLTAKPVLYAANVMEDDLADDGASNEFVGKVREYAAAEHNEVFVLCAKIEEEISDLDEADKKEFLADLGVEGSGLDRLIAASYKLLGLISYLTAGPQESRAWTITIGTKAPQAAGKIHSDFERGFIRAEVVHYDDLMRLGSYNAAKEQGLVRSEGKEYVMKDGDVVLFRFNV